MPRSLSWLLPLFPLLLAGCSRPAAPAAPPVQTADGMDITLTASPPAHTGDNTFVVTLADDATKAPIGNANINAIPQMLSPRLPGTSSSGRAQGNGVYNLPVRLGIATRYSITLHIERTGHPETVVSFRWKRPSKTYLPASLGSFLKEGGREEIEASCDHS